MSNMRKRGRPETKPFIKAYIRAKALKHSETPSRQLPREALARELIHEIEDIGEVPPAESTLTRWISGYRNDDDPLEEPWHLDTLEEYPISSAAVAMILELKAKGLKTLTVRDARWLDKLSGLPLPAGVIRLFAQQLSMYEGIMAGDFQSAIHEQQEILPALQDSERLNPLKDLAEHRPEGFDATAAALRLIETQRQLNKEARDERAHTKEV